MAHEELIKEGETALRKNSNLRPEEIEDYYRKKGMDKKEAKEAIEKWKASSIVEEHKKAQKTYSQPKSNPASGNSSAPTEKKSSLGFWIVMLLLAAVIAYFFYSGYLSLDMFKNWNFKFK